MTDVSDGLIADLGHIAEASKVRIDVASGKVDIPSQMNDIGQAVGVDPLQWVLTGGEDHAIVATFPSDVKLPARWKVIGEVLHPSALPRVTVDGAPWTHKGGWDHFGEAGVGGSRAESRSEPRSEPRKEWGRTGG